MHPLHDYVAKQLTEKLRSRRVVVWYDSRREFEAFVGEVRGGPKKPSQVIPVSVGGFAARLADHSGSMFELRALVEPIVCTDLPEPTLLYLPGVSRDDQESALMELEKAGTSWEPQLKQLARNVLLQKYTVGNVDELVSPDRPVTYEELARAASDTSTEPPSLLRVIFHDAAGSDGILALWLMASDRDQAVAEKKATRELAALVKARLGLVLPPETSLDKLRANTLRYVLVGEFRSDLTCDPPNSLASVAAPKNREETEAVRELAKRLRASFPEPYVDAADRLEVELGLRNAKLPAEGLGDIDTFRFEESALLAHCRALVAEKKFDEALKIIEARHNSFWLGRDVARLEHWAACRQMAELGRAASAATEALRKPSSKAEDLLAAYVSRGDGLYRLDLAQRRLETRIAGLEEEPDEKALGIVRRMYEDACDTLSTAFTTAFASAGWSVPNALHQTRVFADVVAGCPQPVAYFLVDAMRFEMGVELADRLAKASEVTLRPAIAALPSITPVGMAALQPGASASFSIVEHEDKLCARIDDAFLGDLAARKKFAASRVPKSVDFLLDDLLDTPQSKVAKRIDSASVIFVRSQEIDLAGESGGRSARMVMNNVIGDLARAIRKLAVAGVEHAVVSADHGHLFGRDREESMRMDAPMGFRVDLHRRCWIGRGGSTPPGAIRVSAAELGYDSDLDFVFPKGGAVFKAGGDLAFHHGGASLQELVVPVLTVRTKAGAVAKPAAASISVTGFPATITNRIFTAAVVFGEKQLILGARGLQVRPLLISDGKQVGAAGMAVNAELDQTTGCVTLQPSVTCTLGFRLMGETAKSIRIVLQDPATDAELFRSPEIPVQLGM